jgi:hypothetical protein
VNTGAAAGSTRSAPAARSARTNDVWHEGPAYPPLALGIAGEPGGTLTVRMRTSLGPQTRDRPTGVSATLQLVRSAAQRRGFAVWIVWLTHDVVRPSRSR